MFCVAFGSMPLVVIATVYAVSPKLRNTVSVPSARLKTGLLKAAAVGVPEISPPALIDRPGGSDPLLRAHVTPPVAGSAVN